MDIGILYIIMGCCVVFELIKVLRERRSIANKAAYVVLVIILLTLIAAIYNYIEKVNPVAKTPEATEQLRKASHQRKDNRQFVPNAEQEKICSEMKRVISSIGKFYTDEDRLPRSLAELTVKKKLDINHKFDYNIRNDYRILFWRSPEHYELSCMDNAGNTFYYTNGDYDFMDSTAVWKICWFGEIAVISH
jgi:hypothetical protein